MGSSNLWKDVVKALLSWHKWHVPPECRIHVNCFSEFEADSAWQAMSPELSLSELSRAHVRDAFLKLWILQSSLILLLCFKNFAVSFDVSGFSTVVASHWTASVGSACRHCTFSACTGFTLLLELLLLVQNAFCYNFQFGHCFIYLKGSHQHTVRFWQVCQKTNHAIILRYSFPSNTKYIKKFSQIHHLFSLRECSLRRRSSLVAQVFYSNWPASFFQTKTGSWRLPRRYNSDGSIERITVAKARSLLATNFAVMDSSVPSGAGSSPVTIFHRPSFMSAIRHWIFQVG